MKNILGEHAIAWTTISLVGACLFLSFGGLAQAADGVCSAEMEKHFKQHDQRHITVENYYHHANKRPGGNNTQVFVQTALKSQKTNSDVTKLRDLDDKISDVIFDVIEDQEIYCETYGSFTRIPKERMDSLSAKIATLNNLARDMVKIILKLEEEGRKLIENGTPPARADEYTRVPGRFFADFN